MKELKWFTDRIWQRIYRDEWTCDCKVCKDVVKNWLIILNKEHASYLYACQEIYTYRDKK